MPHAISPERASQEDETLPDAPPEAASELASGPSAKDEGEAVGPPEPAKADVKLEDLFNDMDDDEEFPASSVQDEQMDNSPEAPSYV